MDSHGLIPEDGFIATVGKEASSICGKPLEEGFENQDCAVCCRCQRLFVGGSKGELEMSALKAKLLAYVLFDC